jgi:RNA polymerase sigma-70 factor (ECF subfamily)
VRDEVLSWVSACVLPHERFARLWLRRIRVEGLDEDDIVQEAYARLIGLTNTAHIRSGRAYFMMTVRNLAWEHVRRQKLVRIEMMAEVESLSIIDDEPSAEDWLSGRQQLTLVKSLIEGLPDRCRDVFKLRKIEGLSQREAAAKLGITENIVEKQIAIGLKEVLRQLAERGLDEVIPSAGNRVGQKRKRHGN